LILNLTLCQAAAFDRRVRKPLSRHSACIICHLLPSRAIASGIFTQPAHRHTRATCSKSSSHNQQPQTPRCIVLSVDSMFTLASVCIDVDAIGGEGCVLGLGGVPRPRQVTILADLVRREVSRRSV
jgi:hypothetical protein